MTFEEAVEQEYTIFVADSHVARRLEMKYRKNRFKSIRSILRTDGLRKVFVDQKLYFDCYEAIEQIEMLMKGIGHVVYGSVPDVYE
ncbi:hypothetical protein A0U40_09785 [[Bacillus] sp. KCTC 13219]|nr:hypothetical protein A0U40_09785 [[Bacillus] sp. KCTC 13219]